MKTYSLKHTHNEKNEYKTEISHPKGNLALNNTLDLSMKKLKTYKRLICNTYLELLGEYMNLSTSTIKN